METTENLFQSDNAFGGKPQVNRQIAKDVRGYIAEYLSSALQNCNPLGNELIDKEKFLELLKTFGALGQREECQPSQYCGSTRSGCQKEPLTVNNPCEAITKLNLDDLLQSDFWKHRFYQPIDNEWQPTLFQPVGGMDKIVEGFTKRIGKLISYNTEVTAIKLMQNEVKVSGINRRTGAVFERVADYCVSSIPLPLLQKIPANFSDKFKSAVDSVQFDPTCKLGWQANERFWESDKYRIYGGISWIDDIISQMWYPSNNYFSKKGSLTGAFNFGDTAINFAKLSLQERLISARNAAIKLHPEFEEDSIVPENLGLSIAWHNVPFQRGGWTDWDRDNPEHEKAYSKLLEPDGRFHIVGDQISTLPGWQEGAMMSAEHVVKQIAGITEQEEFKGMPHSKHITQGLF